MKRFSIILILALALVALFGLTNASAYSAYTSGFQVQNLEATTANLVITYYNQAGTAVNSIPDTIDGNKSKTYFPIHAAEGFNGSVVVSSDKKVAAVTNLIGDGKAFASYVGLSQGAASVSIPLLMQNNSGFYTWFNVQNTGSAPATVNVAYSDSTTAGPFTVQPGAAKTFDQKLETHSAKVFAATVTATGSPVAVVVVQYDASTLFAYNGFTGGTTAPVLPLINANNSGYVTGVQLQNTGASTTNVTISYTPIPGLGTACTETQAIPAGQSTTFALFAFTSGANSTCAAGATFVGSARVTANSASMPLVGIVNQLKPGLNGEAYGSFDTANATGKVVLPLIMDRNSGFYTGYNIMNVSGSTQTISCAFSGSTFTQSESKADGAAMLGIQNNQIANGYVGSATCTAGGDIVAVVNELGSGSGDLFMVYEGVND